MLGNVPHIEWQILGHLARHEIPIRALITTLRTIPNKSRPQEMRINFKTRPEINLSELNFLCYIKSTILQF